MKRNDIWLILISRITFIFGVLFIIAPGLLHCSCVKELISGWFFSLEKIEYKAEYIGALGGMIGSIFAVFGAYSLQRNSERRADEDRLKKYATIVYYDIDFFFKEIHELYIWVIDATEANLYENHTISGSDEKIRKESERFKKIRAAVATTFVHIDKNWIEDVAELSCKLSKEKIELIYQFYGRATEIKLILQYNSASELTDKNVFALKAIMKTLYGEDDEQKSTDNSAKQVEFPQEYQNITKKLQDYM